MVVLRDEEWMEGNTECLCLYPHTRPSISSTKRGKKCHPSRRDEIKDVVLKQLMIMHLHRRTCHLYPSNCFLCARFGTLFFLLWLLLCVFIFERQRQNVSGLGQREREAQNPKQDPGSELSAQSPTRGSNSQTAKS